MAGQQAEAQHAEEYGEALPYEAVTREEFNALLARVRRLERRAMRDDE
jgi:hypothetical protein